MIGSFSMIGMASDSKNKVLTILLFFLFFSVVFGAIFLVIRSKQGRIASQKNNFLWVSKATGYFLALVALVLPSMIMSRIAISNLRFNIPVGIALTLGLIAIGVVGVRLINHAKTKLSLESIGGYLVVIAGAAAPGLLISRYDPSNDTIGVVYFMVIFIAVLCWWGNSLIVGKQQEF
jgi:hypothetical protein